MGEFYLRVKRQRPDAKLEMPAHPGDAGYDVRAYPQTELRLYTGDRARVPLGLAIEFPSDYVCMVQQKSGLASDFGINTIGNIIDSGYRGEIHAVIVNHGREPLSIVPGQKIAQLLFLRVGVAPIEYVEELNGTARGTGGFGSTK